LIGKKFAFFDGWKRNKICWICDRHKLVILLCEVNSQYVSFPPPKVAICTKRDLQHSDDRIEYEMEAVDAVLQNLEFESPIGSRR